MTPAPTKASLTQALTATRSVLQQVLADHKKGGSESLVEKAINVETRYYKAVEHGANVITDVRIKYLFMAYMDQL